MIKYKFTSIQCRNRNAEREWREGQVQLIYPKNNSTAKENEKTKLNFNMKGKCLEP